MFMSLGGVSYTYTYDEEDRLTKLTSSAGLLNIYTYNGLGLRVGLTDSQGSHAFLCDGTTPASQVLADGFAVYMSPRSNRTQRRHCNHQ